MPEYNVDFVLNVAGLDQMEEATTSVTDLNQAVDDSAAAGDEAGTSFGNTLRSVTGYARGIAGLDRAYMMYTMTQMRVEMAEESLAQRQDTLANAQMTYTQEVAKYGPASDQAVKAHNNLERAVIAVQKAQERLNMVHMQSYMMLLPMGVRILSSMRPLLTGIAEALGIQTVAQEAENVALEDTIALEAAATMGATTPEQVAAYGEMRAAFAAGMIPTAQAGGYIGTSGYAYVHAGETIVSPYTGFGMGSLGVGGDMLGGEGGAVNITVTLEGDIDQFMRVSAAEIEYENQRRGPINWGT